MSKTLQRIILAALFVVYAAVEARLTITSISITADVQRAPMRPFGVNDRLSITWAVPLALDAGVQKGDTLSAINGHPVGSYMETSREFYRHRAGDRLVLTLRRGGGEPFDATMQLRKRQPSNWVRAVLVSTLNIITPWSCILLGFLVAFRRPGDPVAYALLGLLLCVSQLVGAEGFMRQSWEPPFTWIAQFLDIISNRALLVAWLWFAMLFPDPDSPHKLWPWSPWVLGAPYLVSSFLGAIWFTVTRHIPGGVPWLAPFGNIPDAVEIGWGVVLVSIGFANFGRKLKNEARPVMRRRLRWVLFGLTLGVLPVLLLFSISALFKTAIDSLPQSVWIPIILTPFFVPLTLAYAVLVDRLFDVGVFIRQGLLASRTVSIVRAALIAGLIWTASTLFAQSEWEGVVGCAVGVLVVGLGAEWLRKWVDRHFFQEAVNSEHLLMELSTEVRKITSPETLLRTVADRIADALHVSHVEALVPNATRFVPAYASASDVVVSDLLFTDPRVGRLREQRQALIQSDELLLPLNTSNGLNGILRLGPKRSEEPYSHRDIRLLESVANQTGLALENTRLTATVAEEAAHRERIMSELEIARKVQERLFPKKAPRVAGIDLAGRCQPAQSVGGDYYDFLENKAGSIGLAIGDVSGKGVPAALLMAGLQASLRGLTMSGTASLADLMANLNVLVYDASPANRFATFLYALYQPATRILQYSCAGHNPALLLRAGECEPIWLKTQGVALGLRRNSTYEQAHVVLESGDWLVLYTDGVTEARNLAGEEFGEERLAAVIRSDRLKAAAEMLQDVIGEIEAFAAGAPQHDDITMIIGRVE